MLNQLTQKWGLEFLGRDRDSEGSSDSRDDRTSFQSSSGLSSLSSGLSGSSKYSRSTYCSTDESDFSFNLSRINNEINLMKLKEKERQMVQKIMGGSETQRILFQFISNPKFDNAVMVCILINILLLIMPTMPARTGHSFKRLKNGMDCIDDFFMAVYLVECVLKIYVMRNEYFKAWDLLDFNIVLISIFDSVIGVMNSFSTTGSVLALGSAGVNVAVILRLVRATRILRVLRTLKFVDKLQRYTVTIWKSIQTLGPTMQLTIAFVFVFTAIGCSLFGNLIPEHFGNIILTFFTLIRIITLDDWFEIQQDGSVEHGFNTPLCIYLICFIFLMVFGIFNLLIAVLVDAFNVSNEENEVKISHVEAREMFALQKIEAMAQWSDNDDDSENHDHDNPGNKMGLESSGSHRSGSHWSGSQWSGPSSSNRPFQKKKDVVEEDFCRYFEGCVPTDLTISQWYYRLLPAIERQKFFYNDQMSAFNKMVDEASRSSEEAFICT